jgi:hypothetical protein
MRRIHVGYQISRTLTRLRWAELPLPERVERFRRTGITTGDTRISTLQGYEITCTYNSDADQVQRSVAWPRLGLELQAFREDRSKDILRESLKLRDDNDIALP